MDNKDAAIASGFSAAGMQVLQATSAGYYDTEQRANAVAVFNAALSHPEAYTRGELSLFLYHRDLWAKSLDPTYAPPPRVSSDAASPLSIKSDDAKRTGHFAAALEYAWTLLQYSAAGTIQFGDALADVADCAALCEDIPLAQWATEMFLAHCKLYEHVAEKKTLPTGWSDPEPGGVRDKFPVPPRFSPPVRAGIRGPPANGAACWVAVLEMAIYEVPARIGGWEDGLQSAQKALRTYYALAGKTEALERLDVFLKATPLEESE